MRDKFEYSEDDLGYFFGVIIGVVVGAAVGWIALLAASVVIVITGLWNHYDPMGNDAWER